MRISRIATLALCAAATLPMSGALRASEHPGPRACDLPSHPGRAIGALADELPRYAKLPESCLKSVVMDCSAAAERGVLESGDAMMCSMAYETLLKHTFSGDFDALLGWWRGERRTVSLAEE